MVAIFTAVSRSEVDAAFGTLFARRRYSVAAFDGGRLIHYLLRPRGHGIRRQIAAQD